MNTPVDIAALVASSKLPATPEIKFQPLTLADLLNMPPKRWLINQVAGAGDAIMVYGPPGSGKTFIVIDMIFAACTGRQWARRFGIERPLTVAYAAGEGASGLPQRFAAAAQYYGVNDMSNLTIFINPPQLFGAATEYSVVRFVDEWKNAGRGPLDLLVVDTMHSAIDGADENSSQDMGRVLASAKYATRELGCTFMFVHHSNKAGTGERGSSSLRGAMDCMIECKTTGGKFEMVCEKLKDGERWKPQTFDLVQMGDSVRVWWDDATTTETPTAPSTELLTLMKSKPGVKFTAKQLAEPMGQTQSAILNILSRLVSNGEVKRELHEVEKPPSSRNPWVYWCE